MKIILTNRLNDAKDTTIQADNLNLAAFIASLCNKLEKRDTNVIKSIRQKKAPSADTLQTMITPSTTGEPWCLDPKRAFKGRLCSVTLSGNPCDTVTIDEKSYFKYRMGDANAIQQMITQHTPVITGTGIKPAPLYSSTISPVLMSRAVPRSVPTSLSTLRAASIPEETEPRPDEETHPVFMPDPLTNLDSTASSVASSPSSSPDGSPVFTTKASPSLLEGDSALRPPASGTSALKPSSSSQHTTSHPSKKSTNKPEGKKAPPKNNHNKLKIALLSFTMALSIALALSFFQFSLGLTILYAALGGITTFLVAHKNIKAPAAKPKKTSITVPPSSPSDVSPTHQVSDSVSPGSAPHALARSASANDADLHKTKAKSTVTRADSSDSVKLDDQATTGSKPIAAKKRKKTSIK